MIRQLIQPLLDIARDHKPVVIAITVACVLLCIMVLALMRGCSSSAGQVEVYPVQFYDEATGKLFVGDSTDIPPIKAPSGENAPDGNPAGVRAYVMSCGPCTDDGGSIVYLERFTPAGRQAIQELHELPGGAPASRIIELQGRIDHEREVRTPTGEVWHRADEIVAPGNGEDIPDIDRRQAIIDAFTESCAERNRGVTICFPRDEKKK